MNQLEKTLLTLEVCENKNGAVYVRELYDGVQKLADALYTLYRHNVIQGDIRFVYTNETIEDLLKLGNNLLGRGKQDAEGVQ